MTSIMIGFDDSVNYVDRYLARVMIEGYDAIIQNYMDRKNEWEVMWND